MIGKEVLKRIILEQEKLFTDDFIKREKLRELQEKSRSDFIIIISGIRRCGKSVLLDQFRHLQKEKAYYLNFDDERLHNFEIDDFESLYEVFTELFGKESAFYFDEIQNIKGWERFIRRLNDYKNKIYITGSNANLLSKELGTRLTGRYLQLELFPASFREFLIFKKFNFIKRDFYIREKSIQFRNLFHEYAQNGGFLKYLISEEKDFFKILYDNILYRDIISRYSLSFEKGIKDIFHYLISNVSKPFSYTTLKSVSNISSVTTIKDYVSFLENSYLLFTIPIYDNSLKKQLINPKKIYAIDTGFANAISFKFSQDKGRVLENIVFLQLRRMGKEIYYHKQKKECDFVIKEGLEIVEAIQVTDDMIEVETREREISGLTDALKTYGLKKGIILTDDKSEDIEYEGFEIKVIPVWRWLLDPDSTSH